MVLDKTGKIPLAAVMQSFKSLFSTCPGCAFGPWCSYSILLQNLDPRSQRLEPAAGNKEFSTFFITQKGKQSNYVGVPFQVSEQQRPELDEIRDSSGSIENMHLKTEPLIRGGSL